MDIATLSLPLQQKIPHLIDVQDTIRTDQLIQ